MLAPRKGNTADEKQTPNQTTRRSPRISNVLYELRDVRIRLHMLSGAMRSDLFDPDDGHIFASGIEEAVRKIDDALNAEFPLA